MMQSDLIIFLVLLAEVKWSSNGSDKETSGRHRDAFR
jgi:hypothetical protein